VVYGAWRTADRVVLALHGGPSEHWSLSYDPGLQAFARAGLAVVALNPRGSTGYGREHELAIKGKWGGPDLADVVAVATHLARARGPRPAAAVYGTSYGAFLGLLALAEAPHLLSRCVAIAPFRSGAALYADAGPRVRALLDRLDGTVLLNDPPGPRDLVRLAPRMRGRILVVHGKHDPVIPVRHSRELVEALRAHSGVKLIYRELAGGHQPVRPAIDDPEYAAIVKFLCG
jgi:dipeptidyl aminopeptidase/acylaminoacyl peptidase